MKKILLISLLFSFGSVFGTPRWALDPVVSPGKAINLDEIKKRTLQVVEFVGSLKDCSELSNAQCDRCESLLSRTSTDKNTLANLVSRGFFQFNTDFFKVQAAEDTLRNTMTDYGLLEED